MTLHLKKSLIGAALAAACLAAPQAATAQSFAVQVNGVQCNDNAACDMDADANEIVFLATVAGLSLTVNTSLTNTPGGPAFSAIDMGWIISSLTTALPGPFAIQFLASATGFTFPSAGSASVLTNQLNGNFVGGATISGQSWADSSNTLFGMGGTTAGAQGLNTMTSIAFLSSTPYALTQELDFLLNAGSFTSGDFATTVVPEPAPLALIGIALAALAFARRREKN